MVEWRWRQPDIDRHMADGAWMRGLVLKIATSEILPLQ